MDSRRWMDLDGSWVYSTNPRRQTDSRLKYSTLPGRSHDLYRAIPDDSRRPADDRGKYVTIPGRFINREPMRDQSPYRLRSTSRLPQSVVLQNSTNRDPFLPPGPRRSAMGRMDQNADTRIDTRIRDRIHYDWDKYLARKNVFEHERKRQKLPRDAHTEIMNFSPTTKRRPKGKLIQMDSFYGGWESDYTLENKVQVAKHDEWEPLTRLPKALQNQLLSQTINVELPQLEKRKSLVTNSGENTQEKRSWWSKLVKQSKSGVTNAAPSEVPQDKANKIDMEHGSLMNHGVHKQEGFKENHPQIRKRKGPPPYVSPPSYDYPHRTFPINKEKLTHTRVSNQIAINQTILLNDSEEWQESREKMPRYSLEHPKASRVNLSSGTNVRESRGEAGEKQKFDTAYQNIMKGRKLPRAYSTWTGSKSDDFLDHIYEIVEGGGSPITPNVPTFQKTKSDLDLQTGERICGTVSIPLQRDQSMPYTLPRTSGKGIHDGNDTIRRENKNSANSSQRLVPPFDARPPIPLHGVKLPRELGFSYTSGTFQSMDRRIGGVYTNNKESYTNEQGREGRRPLRVITSKEPSLSPSNKGEYSWYGHTLPLKKDTRKIYMQEEINHVDSRNQRLSTQDTDFPRWRDPGNISTLPGRGRDQNRWRHGDGLKLGIKYNLSEPSNTRNNAVVRRNKPKEAVTDKIHPPSSKESEGIFVIDATCVVVRAEYIFPPIMEQVKFLHKEASKGDILSNKRHSAGFVKNERTPHLYSHSKPFSSLAPKTCSQKTHSKAQYCNELSNENIAPSLKERATRILGLSIGELDSLNEARDQHKTSSSKIEAVNADQGPRGHEHEFEKLNGNNNRKVSMIRNCKEMPCILEVADLHAIFSEEDDYGMQINFQRSLYDNATVDIDEVRKQNVLISADIQDTNNNKNILLPSKIKARNVEIPTPPQKNHDHVQEPLLNHQSSSMMEEDSRLPKENRFDITKSPSGGPDCMKLETSLNEQLQEDVELILAENTCNTSTETLELHVPEKPKQDECMLLEAKDQQCPTKENEIAIITHENNSDEKFILPIRTNGQHPSENQWQVNSIICANDGPSSADLTVCDEPDHSWLGRQRGSNICLIPQTDQTSSPRPLMKTYARRPNYYAKDLREAVSRIRRHTAPDSDTDDDLEKSVLDSIKYEEQVPDEGVTSCSSDTSDSEVTVILCEKEEETISIPEDIDVRKGINGQSSEEVTTQDFMIAESPSGTLQDGEFGEQSNVFQRPEQEPVFDLNSCINEILQDLSKTEKEFFSSNEDHCSVSATTSPPDQPTTGKHQINVESSMSE